MLERTSIIWNQLTASRIARSSTLALLILATAFFANAKNNPAPVLTDPIPVSVDRSLVNEQPRIEVVFALDTTGSMSGLISGAKQKIWSIVNQMADANSTPDIRVGLIGYRDRGDQYITKRFELTDDIDALYANLQDLSTGGGGDGPESVNQALNEAVLQMGWSSDQDVYKVIFLVGDAPPHMDYQNDVPYAASVEFAKKQGIVINTIQCGNQAETARVFAGIATLSQGQFASIAQSGGMVASHTPMDDEMSALNAALAETVLAYGMEDEKNELHRKSLRSLAARPAVAASRLSYLAKMGGVVNSGRADLVDALQAGEVDLDDLEEEALPSAMQRMNRPERERYVKEKTEQRDEIKSKITELAKSRDEFLKQETKKRAAEGKADAFDDRLLGAVRSQAAEKGIVY